MTCFPIVSLNEVLNRNVQWKAEPIHRDIAVLLEALSPAEGAKQFASIAATHIAEAKRINRVARGVIRPRRLMLTVKLALRWRV